MIDPRDRFDIPDEREPEHHIPDAVRDAVCPECDQPAVVRAVGQLPVCAACDWTGWDVVSDLPSPSLMDRIATPQEACLICDEYHLDPHIPEAVCDVQTGLGDELTKRVGEWLTERSRVSYLESIGQADSDDWHYSEDDAAEIVTMLAGRFDVLPIIEPGTVVMSQDDEDHTGIVIEPFVRCNMPGWILVHWTHAGICDEHVRDVTPIGDSLPPPDPDSALSIDECDAAGVDGTLRDM